MALHVSAIGKYPILDNLAEANASKRAYIACVGKSVLDYVFRLLMRARIVLR